MIIRKITIFSFLCINCIVHTILIPYATRPVNKYQHGCGDYSNKILTNIVTMVQWECAKMRHYTDELQYSQSLLISAVTRCAAT